MRLAEKGMVLVVVLAVLLSLGTIDTGQTQTPVEPLQELTQGWYRMEAGERVAVDMPGTLTIDDGGDLVLYNDTLTQEAEGYTICTRGAVYRLAMTLADQTLYAYEDTAFPRNDQMRAKLDCIAVLPREIGTQPLTITLKNPGDGVFELPAVYLGTSSAVFVHQLGQDAFNLLCAFTMVLLSIITLCISAYLSRIHMRDRRFGNIACFLLLCAVWCTMDASIVQELTGHSPVPCYLAFYALMTLGIPMLHFVRNTGEMKRYRSIRVWIVLFYLNVIVQSLLHVLGGVEMIDMLFATHMLLGSGCAWLAALMLREYTRTKRKDILVTLLAFALLAGCGILALVLYWALKISFYGLIFECGILILIACLLGLLITTMGENLRFKIEAVVYKRLSQQDRLTGLANRRSFDEFLATLETDACSYKNVALVFLDLNWLKYTNDHFGHSAGDELIINAARCIEHTFSPLGSCYRIGGDEFAVIMTDPRESEEEWNALLEEAVAHYNQTGRYRLSIARGSSLLRDGNGEIKRLSDWKYEADQAMYQHKSRQKAEAQREAEAVAAALERGGDEND